MKEVIIKYKSNKTLEALRELGKYLGFSVLDVPVEETNKHSSINGVTVIQGDETIDLSELNDVFTERHLNASELRRSGWQRNA